MEIHKPNIHEKRTNAMKESEEKQNRYQETFATYYTLRDIQSMDKKVALAADIIESTETTPEQNAWARGFLSKYGQVYASAHV